MKQWVCNRWYLDDRTHYRVGGSVKIFLHGNDYHMAYMVGFVLPSVGRFLITFRSSTQDIAKSLMLTANRICDFLAWIFATPKCKGKQAVTHKADAKYTRSARILYEDDSVTGLFQKFTPTSMKDEFIMDTVINGTTPQIPEGISTIYIKDYQTVYVQTQSGILESNFMTWVSAGSSNYSIAINQSIYSSSNQSQSTENSAPAILHISNVHTGFLSKHMAVTLSMTADLRSVSENSARFIIFVILLTGGILALSIGIVLICKKVNRRIRLKDNAARILGPQLNTVSLGRLEPPGIHDDMDYHHYEEIPDLDVNLPLKPSQSNTCKSGCCPTNDQNHRTAQGRNPIAIPPDDYNYDHISHVNQAQSASLTPASCPSGDYIHPIYYSLDNKDDDNDERSTEYGKRSFLRLSFFSSGSSSMGDSSEQAAVTMSLEKSNETDSMTNMKTIFSLNDEDNENNVNETALKEVAEVDSNTTRKELYGSNTFLKELYGSETDSVQIEEEVDSLSTDSDDLAFVQHRQKADPNTYSKLSKF